MNAPHTHDFHVKNVSRLSPTRVKMTVEIPSQTVVDHEVGAARRYSQHASIPGFRPGKAPLDMVRSRFKEQILSEVLGHLLEHGLSEALEQAKLFPINQPKVRLVQPKFEVGMPLEFEAEFEIEPEIELRDYKQIPLNVGSEELTDEDINKTLDNLRDRMASLEPLESEKPGAGDYGVMEIGFKLVAEPDRVEPKQPLTVELGSGKLIPGLDSALLELKVGETKEIKATFPEDYFDEKLRGKEAVFECSLIELKKRVLPELDDAWAEQVRPGKTLAELKEELKPTIAEAKKDNYRQAVRQQILSHLVKSHSFDVPTSLVERQAYQIFSEIDADRRKQSKGLAPNWSQEELDEIKKRADYMVRGSLLLKQVAAKENLTLQEDRVDKKIDEIAGELQQNPKETRQYLEGKGLMDRVRNEVLTDQVYEFLIQNAIMKS